MNIAALSLADQIGTLLGFTLTLFVFSYVFGDNVLFRLTIHVFIGVAAGYAVVVAWYNVIWPQLIYPFINGSRSALLFAVIPLVLSGVLLLKVSPRLSPLGNPAMAYMVGVGVAAAIGGAVMGTIFPQVGASINLFDLDLAQQGGSTLWLYLAKGSVVLVGTLTTLIYFHFGARSIAGQPPERRGWIEALAGVGQVFIAITFGVLFAGVYTASLTALIERIHFLGDIFIPFF